MKKLFFLFAILSNLSLFSQEHTTDSDKEKISSILENYFDLEREAIHLHLSKNTYLTSESIWFQGYVLNRKNNKPHITTNVYAILMDEKGNKLSEQLLFASNGSFSGKIKLNTTFHSGMYYIHTYTNWMNNFSENESSLTKINIVNPEEGIKNYSKINLNSLEVSITPEGGNLVQDVSNTIGIQIKDCRGNSPKDIMANLKNGKGETIRSAKLNSFGNGKIEFIPSDESYTINIEYNGKIIEKKLPKASSAGIALTVNNYTFPDKTILNIKTNKQTLKKISDKKLYMVIHQDQKYSINPVNIPDDKPEQIVYIPNKILSTGINTIRIIDSDLKEYASRLTYIYPKLQKNISVVSKKTNYDNINLSFNCLYPEAILSSAILPEKSTSLDNNNIYAGLTVNPYLNKPLQHASYYFKSPTKTQLYELDLALLNETAPKYSWELMKVSAPKTKFDFDIGLTLKGKIDPAIKDKSSCKAKLICYKSLILTTTDVSDTGEYEFKNLLIPDSTNTELTLLRLPDFEKVNTTLSPHIENRKRDFLKSVNVTLPDNCNEDIETIDFNTFEFSKKYPKAIILNEVEVEHDNKPTLRYANQMGNGNLRGIKIEGNLVNYTLFRFLAMNGFKVTETQQGITTISNYTRNTLNGEPATPVIFLDGWQVRDIIQLDNLLMSDIDEIFLNPHAIVPSMNNFIGVIKIYTKRLRPYQPQNKKNPNDFYITNGFSLFRKFRNEGYETLDKEGFENFGLIGWSSKNLSGADGNFEINIKDFNATVGKTVIQGITPDGDLFQDEIDITLKE